MIFRKAKIDDVETVEQILLAASGRLGAAGIDQWQRGYPNRMSVERDVADGVGYVVCDGEQIVAYGAVIFTGEVAYNDLTGGEWLTSGEYAVVHRLCVAADRVGQGWSRCFMQCAEQLARDNSLPSIRIDTPPANQRMQSLIASLGFTYCGDVIIESRRLAYEKIL